MEVLGIEYLISLLIKHPDHSDNGTIPAISNHHNSRKHVSVFALQRSHTLAAVGLHVSQCIILYSLGILY
jgi:hypothetical protein